MNSDKKCCGTCRYYVESEIPSEDERICDNGEAEEYGIETPSSHCCIDFEKKERKG
ncbi:MAG: hypothetical protein HFH41_03970 [Lachnospiraceae bacterium]|nr:hypothetical protein [Lachnospiraceae bacterium]